MQGGYSTKNDKSKIQITNRVVVLPVEYGGNKMPFTLPLAVEQTSVILISSVPVLMSRSGKPNSTMV